jgi:hypothetical protein
LIATFTVILEKPPSLSQSAANWSASGRACRNSKELRALKREVVVFCQCGKAEDKRVRFINSFMIRWQTRGRLLRRLRYARNVSG